MQVLLIVFLSFFALLSCKHAEPLPNHAEAGERTPFPEEKIFKIQDIGLDTMDGLIPFATTQSADGGSHQLIFELSDDGKADSVLLLIHDNLRNPEKERKTEGFSETYEAGWKIRTPLTTEETLAKLESMKAKIFAEGYRARYEYFYDGGAVEPDPKNHSDDPDDPFAYDPYDGKTQDEIDREVVRHVNKYTLYDIARWTSELRRLLNTEL